MNKKIKVGLFVMSFPLLSLFFLNIEEFTWASEIKKSKSILNKVLTENDDWNEIKIEIEKNQRFSLKNYGSRYFNLKY